MACFGEFWAVCLEIWGRGNLHLRPVLQIPWEFGVGTMIYIHENDYEFHFKFNICDFTYFRLTHSAGFWSSDSPYRAELPIIIFWVHHCLDVCRIRAAVSSFIYKSSSTAFYDCSIQFAYIYKFQNFQISLCIVLHSHAVSVIFSDLWVCWVSHPERTQGAKCARKPLVHRGRGVKAKQKRWKRVTVNVVSKLSIWTSTPRSSVRNITVQFAEYLHK